MEEVLSNILDLHPHNVDSYNAIKNAFSSGMDIVSIVHATGTGKTFNALQLILDNPDKKFVFVTPYVSIIEHINKIILDVKLKYGLDLFNNVEFYTYNAISKMDTKELSELELDYLILDEFHHIGAPVWGEKIEELVELHEGIKVLGISAYTVRDRGTIYERDVVAPDSDELFAGSVVSRYDLIDAMIDKVLPTPIYRSTHVNLEKLIKKIEGLINKNNLSEKEYRSLTKKLKDAKRLIAGKDQAKELFLKNIKNDGKFIYFCPSLSKNGVNDIDTIMDEVRGWLIEAGYSENDFILYKTTSKDKEYGYRSREAFYNDTDLDGNDVRNKLQIMFAINQYNEGIHAPNIDGVILGRETKSDIVFFEQMGRALSVRGDTVKKIKQLSKLPLYELQHMAKSKGIVCNYNSKTQIIKKLVSPVIIDLADNIEYIMELENSYRARVEKNKTGNKRHGDAVKETEEFEGFDIEINYHDLFTELTQLQERFETYTWKDSYELARSYYNFYGNLDVPRNFRTDDGINYDIYGYRLGDWIAEMRRSKDKLDKDKLDKLERIGMIWRCNLTWDESFAYLCKFIKLYGVDAIKTNTVFENIKIGDWLNNQKSLYRRGRLKEDRFNKLNDLGIKWNFTKTWDESYQLLLDFYYKYGHIKLPYLYKTSDGYGLYDWLKYQKTEYRNGNLDDKQIRKLTDLGYDFTIKEVSKGLTMEEYKIVLKEYYDATGALKATRGKTYSSVLLNRNVDIARIVDRIKIKKDEGKLDEEDIKFFEKLGVKWTSYVPKTWEESYAYAVIFYEEYGHLNIPTSYKTSDGYDLGNWIYLQRKNMNSLSPGRIKLLEAIDMIWDRNSERKKVLDVIDANGIDYKKNKNVLMGIALFDIKAKLRYLKKHNIEICNEEGLHSIFMVSNEELINLIGIDYHTLLMKYLPRKDKEKYVKSLQK